jgi:hypothetical protein
LKLDLRDERSRSPLRTRLLAAMRIEPTEDIHEAYRFLEDVRLEGRPVLVAKWPSTRYHIHWPNWLRRPLTLVYNHLAVLAQVARGLAQRRIVIVREYTNLAMALAAPLLWPWRERLILNVNDNFAPGIGALSRASLHLLRRWGFRMMLLDGAHVQHDLTRRFGDMRLLTPYFAVPDKRDAAARADAHARSFRVGFVGYFRPDKGGLAALADAIRGVHEVPGVEVALGYWNRGQVDDLPGDVRRRLTLRETLRYADYLAFLSYCDAIIVLATPAYAMRHSGVLVDSVSRGTPVLCPEYPLLAFQVLQPRPVGLTYRSLSELPGKVREVKSRHAELLQNFDEYLRIRSPRRVSAQLALQWMAQTRASPADAAAAKGKGRDVGD